MNQKASVENARKVKRHVFASLCCLCLFGLFLNGCSPTSQQEMLCIGVECREQPKTAEEFLPIFAEQIQHYNSIAASLRPENAVQGFDAIIVNMERTKARKVQADGARTPISVQEADQYAQTVGYDTEFIFPADTDSRKFVVLTLNETALQDPENFKKYAHIGTYDLFITYVHELFHNYEQPKRPRPEIIANLEREEFNEEYQARAARGIILQQLLNAFTSPDQATESIKKAVATYLDYQTNFPTDATNTHYRDRIEGTAYYGELVSSLQVGYPNLQLQTIDDVYRAYGVIAPTVDINQRKGAVSEGYIIGGLAGLLLDYLHIDWKDELMKDSIKSPLDILANHFKSEISPSDVVLPSEEMLQNYQESSQEESSPEDIEEIAQNLVLLLKDMKSKDEGAYLMMLEQIRAESPEMANRVEELLNE